MLLNQRLHDVMSAKAGQTRIKTICLGLGYTAVTTHVGGMGLAYTYFNSKTGCTLVDNYRDYEGCPALEMLALIKSTAPLERSMALALVNALCHEQLRDLPADTDNQVLFDTLGIGPGIRVAMVGHIKPLVKILTARGAALEIIDEFQGMGNKKDFYRKLSDWADVALITSTAILNNTLEEILVQAGDKVKTALLGPSTPMVAGAYAPWPGIKALAGTVPLNKDALLKAVRHGLGTPHLHRYSKKVTIKL